MNTLCALHLPTPTPPRLPNVFTAVRNFLRCGDLAAGFLRFHCPDCVHEKLLAFIAAVIDHLPPKGKQTVRYYGLYSNKTRGQTSLIPDRIIRPPESSPDLKSPISDLKSEILLVPAKAKRPLHASLVAGPHP